MVLANKIASPCKSSVFGTVREVVSASVSGSSGLSGALVESGLQLGSFWSKLSALKNSVRVTEFGLCTTFGFTQTKSFCLGTPKGIAFKMRPKNSVLCRSQENYCNSDINVLTQETLRCCRVQGCIEFPVHQQPTWQRSACS